ncbi:hypothetical protein LTR85_009373 [Meristemomyces frigidus]|nr:hypothetical protein LTR85_009373 [Meristemomyces frigidus]
MPSGLLALPPELRLQIYEDVAACDTPVSLYFDGKYIYVKGFSAATAASLAVLRVCKKMRREAMSVVWDNLHFDMTAASLKCDFSHLYHLIGEADSCHVAGQMRHVQLLFSPKPYHYDRRLAVHFLQRAKHLYDLLGRSEILKSVAFDCDAGMDGDDTEIDGAFERETVALFQGTFDELKKRGVHVRLVNTDLNKQTQGCAKILL